jgi:hypothetical protein
MLAYNSEPPRLCLDLPDNRFDRLDEQTEEWNRIFAANPLNFPERYRKGEVELAVELCSRRETVEYHLVFQAIPLGGLGHNPPTSVSEFQPGGIIAGNERNQDGVLVSTSHNVECPEKVIPSLVRLALPKDRVNAFGNVGAPTLDIVLEPGSVYSKGERGISGFGVSRGDCGCVNSVIQCRPEIGERIGSDLGEFHRKLSFQANLVRHKIGLIRVRLGKGFVQVWAEEFLNLPLQFGEVFLSAVDLAARAVESRHIGKLNERI